MNMRPFDTEKFGSLLIGADCPFFSAEEKEEKEKGRSLGERIFCRRQVDSTNRWALQKAAEGAPDGSIFLADEQLAGRGRRGHEWLTPAFSAIACSILIRLPFSPERAMMLTPVMGLAAAEGIRAVSGLQAEIKWPNDIVFRGKKLCGILTEMAPDTKSVVIGVGINVNVPSFPEELADKASSLSLELGRMISREEVAAAVVVSFYQRYATFLQSLDFSGLTGAYETMLANRNRPVCVHDPAGSYTGVALGVNEKGELLVRREDTESIETVYAGEVSVRGIYGYV